MTVVAVPSTRAKHRKTVQGRARSHVPRRTQPQATRKPVVTSLPPVAYTAGPVTVPLPAYVFRLWGIRGRGSTDVVALDEVESFTWDDSSAIKSGAVTFREPGWLKAIGLEEGHEVYAEYAEEGSTNYAAGWRMTIVQPNLDVAARERTCNLVNDLQRLRDSTDDFTFVKDAKRPKGWRVDEVLTFICKRYQIETGSIPKMETYITNWRLLDQSPMDVMISALLRERHMAGRKYAVDLDAGVLDPAKKINHPPRLHVYPFRRPQKLYVLGPQLLAATYSAVHDARFATAVTVRADMPVQVKLDKNGHRKVKHAQVDVPLAGHGVPAGIQRGGTTEGTDPSGGGVTGGGSGPADVVSQAGIDAYGFIHRNLYSPDARTSAAARKEGELWLSEIARWHRSFNVTGFGMPFLRRLDAFKFRSGRYKFKQIVYLTDARHNVDSSGYTTQMVWTFDDPFVDRREAKIISKLTDVASQTGRVPVATGGGGGKKKAKNAKPRSPKLGSHTVDPGSVVTPGAASVAAAPVAASGGKKRR